MKYPDVDTVYVPSFEVDPRLIITLPIRDAYGKLDLTAWNEFSARCNAALIEALEDTNCE